MIGLFDSGVGGLSVLKALVESNINDNFLYFGDTKNVPYGTKTKEEILSYTKDIMEFFIKKGVDRAIMACNTSSALVYEDLQMQFSDKIKIYPLIQYAAPYFINTTQTIGVMATNATVKSLAYTKEIGKINPKINIIEKECQNFVEIVEKRLYDNPQSLEYIEEKIQYFKKTGCKKIILGCTHFPYLVPIFKRFAPDIEFIDPAKLLIKSIKYELNQNSALKTSPIPNTEIKNTSVQKDNSFFEFYVSNDPENFKQSGSMFFDIKETPKLVEFIKI